MKKSIKTVFVFTALLLACSGLWAGGKNEKRESLAGIYYGVIPAADCPGISVVIMLNDGGQYKMTYQYLDRSVEVLTFTGAFTYDGNKKMITFDGGTRPSYYKVGKHGLTQLDMDGKEITGSLAENYKLHKAPEPR